MSTDIAKAIAAAREALPDLIPAGATLTLTCVEIVELRHKVGALIAALDAQEPVAWRALGWNGEPTTSWTDGTPPPGWTSVQLAYLAPPAQPVAVPKGYGQDGEVFGKPAAYALIGDGFTAEPYFELCADEKALLAAVTEMFGTEPADDGEDMAAGITEELLATGSHYAEDGKLWLHRLPNPAPVALPEDVARDAARFRFIVNHCSGSYEATEEQPAECWIIFEWQQSKPSERYWTVVNAIDAAMLAAAKGGEP